MLRLLFVSALLTASAALADTSAAPAPAARGSSAPAASARGASVDAIERGPAYGDAQFAPWFSTPPLSTAVAALQAGHPQDALRSLPPHPKDVPTRWLRALALRGAGQPAKARPLFEQLAIAGGPLTDRALHLAALCAIDAGDGAGGERLLAQISPRYVDADQAIFERVRQTMKLRVAGAATARAVEELLAPVFDGTVRADVATAHLLAGDAQLAAGAKDKAREHYRSAWVDHPLSGAADSARDRDRRLGAGPAVPPEKLIRRAEALLDAHRNHEALDQLAHLSLPSLCTGGCPGERTPAAFLQAALAALAPDALPVQHEPTPADVARTPVAPADPLACRAKLDVGRIYRKEHEYAKSRAALSPVLLRCADPDVRARALYLLAQMEALAGKPTAGPLWEALARKFPSSSLADDALFNQSLARRRAGDLAGERALLTDLVDHHLDSDLRAEAQFRLFWSYFNDGRQKEALAVLDQLAAQPDADGAEEERARYWRARALMDDQPGQPGQSPTAAAVAREAARTDLTWLVTERPLTYHGLLARGRLAELDAASATELATRQESAVRAAVAQHAALHAGPLPRDPHFTAAVELLRLGLRAEAAREITAIERAPLRAMGEAGEEPLTLIADLYARAHDFRNAHALVRTELRSLLRRPLDELALRAATLAYPLAFRDQIARAAQSAQVPADLLQALMREESALDPHALSSTGALGLTQVMPSTARMVARRLKLRGYQTQQLLEPDTNIRIGGAYLGELYGRFQHPALALASYNAGPGAVAGWLKARGGLPLDAFVEEIPLDETRGYVKRCLRSFAAYEFLYGKTPAVPQKLAAR